MKYIFVLSFVVGFVFSEAAVAGYCDKYDIQSGKVDCTSSAPAASSSGTTPRSRPPARSGNSAKPKQNPSQNPNQNQPPAANSNPPPSCQKGGVDLLTNCNQYGWHDTECRCRTADEAGMAEKKENDTLNAAVEACSQAKSEAMSGCDKNEDGLQGAESTLSSFATQAGAMGLGACTKLAPAMAGANAAVVAFKTNCSSKRDSCMKACEQSRSSISNLPGNMNAGTLAKGQTRIEDDFNECKKLSANIGEATQAMQNIATAIPGVANCIKATSTDPGLIDYCANNPGGIGCAVAATDCSNPAIAAVNPICICKNNPTASVCTGAQAKADFGSNGGASMTGGSSSGAAGGSIDSDSSFGGLGWGGNGMEPSKGGAEDPGGKKGGGANLGDGGGGGAGGGGDGKGGPGGPAALAVNNGFRGGGGGGGGWGGGGSGGGGDDRAYRDPKNPASNDPNNPNLRDFLPNGKLNPAMANRGLAGISGPDGITGPHSDIWKKVQNRYRVQVEGSKLIP